MVHTNMERTIAYALGEAFEDVTEVADSKKIEDLEGKRVLLVDDNELNREILKDVLVDHGIIVEEADNGSKAVSAVKEREPGYYQFVLMDIEMPVMDGYEATMEIRRFPNRIRANIPIIALTANAFAEDVQASLEAGMDGHIAKPIVMDEVVKAIARNLGR